MAKKKNKKVKIKKDNIFIVILVVIFVGLCITLGILVKNTFKKEQPEVVETQVVDKLDEYGYYLTDHNTEYYKEKYNELKDLLSSDKVDEEKYAKLISELFVIDFYDLNSKLSKKDVGGVQFIAKDYQEVFVKTASNDPEGMYYYVKSDLYGNRKQELPEIDKVEVLSVTKEPFKFDKLNDSNAYKVVITIDYKKDLEYPKTVTLVIAHTGKKLEIVEVK